MERMQAFAVRTCAKIVTEAKEATHRATPQPKDLVAFAGAVIKQVDAVAVQTTKKEERVPACSSLGPAS